MLLERDGELEARAGPRYGEAGIARTSLVRVFLRAAAHRATVPQSACEDLLTPGATLDVLHDVGRRVDELAAVVVVTFRDGEVGRSLQRVLGGPNAGRRERRNCSCAVRSVADDHRSVRDRFDGAVSIVAQRDGIQLNAVDSGVGCAPLRGPGHVGVRGDNAELRLDDVQVVPVQPADVQLINRSARVR